MVSTILRKLYFSSSIFYNALNSGDNPALVSSISLSSVVLIVLFAYLFLKERDDLLIKIISAIITIGGLLLITI